MANTKQVSAFELKAGDVFIESPGCAARIFVRNSTSRGVRLRACYVWTPGTETAWRISFKNDDPDMRLS